MGKRKSSLIPDETQQKEIKLKKRAAAPSKELEPVKRVRSDSILGDTLDEFYDFKKMGCPQEKKDKKWTKFSKVLADPSSKLVLIAVPKGFDVNKLN